MRKWSSLPRRSLVLAGTVALGLAFALGLPDLLLRLDIGSHGARLERVFLQGAHLEEANLSRTHLEGANLLDVYLEGADLRETDLRGAYNLSRAHLQGAIASRTRWPREFDPVAAGVTEVEPGSDEMRGRVPAQPDR